MCSVLMERYMKASMEKFPEVKLLITWLVCLSVVCTQYLLSNGYFSHLLIFYLCSKCIVTGEYCGGVKLDRAEEKRPQIHDRRKFKDPGYKINRGSRMQESPKIQE